MRYLPKSEVIRREMLSTLGLENVDQLFAHIPEYCRLRRPLNLPAGRSEPEILEDFRALAEDNAAGYASFLGAGAYHHFRPVLIEALISRGEWFTAYTPYQPEISQGTLQSIFEFQTMICQLTGMEVANASMYDGSTAMAEAALMARRLTGKSALLAARSTHPQYREVLATYLQHQPGGLREFGYGESGALDAEQLERELRAGDVAAVLLQSPNFFGTVEDWEAAARLAHAHGALLVAVIAEPVSLGLLPPPAAADIVALEAQGFGIPVGFGGPYAGVLATRQKYVRSLPGRLVGEARDRQGRRGYVLTLATREQHIRREKATSNICTNQALCALMASIFMAVYGREGLRELAKQNLAKADYAARAFAAAGVELLFPAPRFHELVARPRRPLAEIEAELLAARIVPGLPLGPWYGELEGAALICVTETATRDAIDKLAAAYAAGARRPARQAKEVSLHT